MQSDPRMDYVLLLVSVNEYQKMMMGNLSYKYSS